MPMVPLVSIFLCLCSLKADLAGAVLEDRPHNVIQSHLALHGRHDPGKSKFPESLLLERDAEDTNGADEVSTGFFAMILDLPNKVSEHISVDVPYYNWWQEFYTFPERRPRTFNLILATLKTWMADLLVQMSERVTKNKQGIDWRRSGAFATFGFIYVGLISWFLYVTLFSELCPHAIRFSNEPMDDKMKDEQGQIDLLKQVLYDNFIVQPFIYFPVFYIIRELTQLGISDHLVPSSGQKYNGPMTAIKDASAKYAKNFKEDNLTSMSIWIPGDIFIYAVPMYLRMPLDHALMFVFIMILSCMRGEGKPK